MDSSRPDYILLNRALEGDANAFAILCDQYRNRVWRIVASVAKGPDVDDLAQDAVVKAYCALKSYRGEASFEAWLCRIATNVAFDYRRSAWKRRVFFWEKDSDIPEEVGETLHEEAERRELQRTIRNAVLALPERQRSPIWLHYFEGFSMADISRLEEVSESTLRSRVQAGLKRLSKSLDGLNSEYFEVATVSEAVVEGAGS